MPLIDKSFRILNESASARMAARPTKDPGHSDVPKSENTKFIGGWLHGEDPGSVETVFATTVNPLDLAQAREAMGELLHALVTNPHVGFAEIDCLKKLSDKLDRSVYLEVRHEQQKTPA